MKASPAKEHLEPRLSSVVKATQYLPPVLLCRRTLAGTRNSQPSHLLPNTTEDRCQGVPRERKEEATKLPSWLRSRLPCIATYSTKERPTFSFLQPPEPQGSLGKLEPAWVQSTRRKLRVDVPRLHSQLDSPCPHSEPTQAPRL